MAAAKRVREAWRSPWFRWMLLATVLFLVLLDLFGLRLVGEALDPEAFGTVSDWFTGILTLGAVGLAAIALRDDRRKLEAEAKERRFAIEEARIENKKREESSRRAEAGRVFAWLEPNQDVLGKAASALYLVLTNATVAPVYRWTASLALDDRTLASYRKHGPILPGVRKIRLVDQALIAEFNRSDTLTPSINLEFIGATGETLRRDGSGNLGLGEVSRV